MPSGVFLQRGGLDVHVVSHIVEHHIHIVRVRGIKHSLELRFGAETLLQNGNIDRPIAVIAGELGIGFRGVELVVVGAVGLLLEVVLTPSRPRVLCDGGNPEGGDTEFVEPSLVDTLGDTCEVATLVVHDVKHLRGVEFSVVGGVAVLEAVNHQGVEHLRVVVVAVQLCHIGYRYTILHGDKQVII